MREAFCSTHSRTTEGRYMVRLPFKTGPPIDIGGSLQIATVLYARRLQSRPEISRPYQDFLREYLELGHMEPVSEKVIPVYVPVYIPHYAVIKESSSTTKLHVVFNASCRTRNGTTLNDHLLVGSKLQQDLPAIIARWRQWRYVYIADIAKMFRQILNPRTSTSNGYCGDRHPNLRCNIIGFVPLRTAWLRRPI